MEIQFADKLIKKTNAHPLKKLLRINNITQPVCAKLLDVNLATFNLGLNGKIPFTEHVQDKVDRLTYELMQIEKKSKEK